jgi:hypothetical protein
MAATQMSLSINAQIYRHLCIAIAERHVRAAVKNFNRYDDTTQNAQEDIAFAWQSGHRPIQEATTYGLDGAYPDQLQPVLLRIYATISYEWHRFLHLTSGENSAVDNTVKSVMIQGPKIAVSSIKSKAQCGKRPYSDISSTGILVESLNNTRDLQHPTAPSLNELE